MNFHQNLIPVAFNIGVCLNMRGLEIRNEVLEKQKEGMPIQEDDYMLYFADARNYLEG